MEKFKVNGKNYFAKWTYDYSKCDDCNKNPTTYCDIIDEDNIVICFATSRPSKNDIFSKRIGRRLSFQRALLGCFNKQDRKDIWEYSVPYFETKLIKTRNAKNKTK